MPARTRWLLTDTKVPTGQTEPASIFFGGDPRSVPLSRFSDRLIDDVFSDMERDARGRATVSFRSPAGQSIAVSMGPNYKGLVLYSTVPPVPGQAPAAGRGGNAGGRGNARRRRRRSASARPFRSVLPARPRPNAALLRSSLMPGITNAMNLAHSGVYKELQSIAPGGRWEESFWISASGY